MDPCAQDRARQSGRAGDDSSRDHSAVRNQQHPAGHHPMRIFKRRGGSRYLYKFQYKGKEYYRSTGSENRREAENLAAAARVRVVRQAAGLEEPDPPRKRGSEKDKLKPAPTLQEFERTFVEWVSITKSEQKGTLDFYRENYRKLLAWGPWAHLGLDQINEAHI